MFTEMVEYCWKLEEKVKAVKSEVKENVQGDNEGKETGTHINGLEQKAEINIWPEQNEEITILKSEERLFSGTTLNIPTSEL